MIDSKKVLYNYETIGHPSVKAIVEFFVSKMICNSKEIF